MQFNFDNTYAKELPGFYSPCQSSQVSAPTIIKINTDLAKQLGINIESDCDPVDVFSGNVIPKGASPLAQVYAGHQFGGFSPQLGDGRALLLGEVIDKNGSRVDIQLKGSGRTPYSRGGDGKSALGPVLREYIVSEAMHALGIPTTRALAAVFSGDLVMRDKPLPGGVFTRVAASHIRFGTFQYFAAQGETQQVQQLADYVIARHYPTLIESTHPYLSLLSAIGEAQAFLVAQWMTVGFIHGVMNTDNMTVSGETIDYGPCAFMDHYAPQTVFSSIDQHGRYAYQNQAPIAQWNLARLAEALLMIIDKDRDQAIAMVSEVINQFPEQYMRHWITKMCKKIGLAQVQDNDVELINELFAAMENQQVDYTLLFRSLMDVLQGNKQAAQVLFNNASRFNQWLVRWEQRRLCENIDVKQSISLIKQENPIYIPRNHKVEEALEAAVSEADYSKFEMLNKVLSQPYEYQKDMDEYTYSAPSDFGIYKTFCGT